MQSDLITINSISSLSASGTEGIPVWRYAVKSAVLFIKPKWSVIETLSNLIQADFDHFKAKKYRCCILEDYFMSR